MKAPEAQGPTPCFNNTLSSGDKTTLAFAFFLAKLDEDPDLKDKLVIFDDPISSLDSHRRTCTQQQIARVSNQVKQVILLSHDPYFLRLIWEGSEKSNTKTLCIIRSGQESTISEWDIEHATRGEYFQNYFALAEYLENGPNGDLRVVARCIRPLLEGNLRLRFPGQFGRGEWLGDMLRKIREANGQDPLNSLKPFLQELSDINDYSRHFHHDQNPDADTYPIVDTELKAYVERTLEVISGVLGVGSVT